MADPLRLLYVDDESDLLEICRIFLEESGDFNVTTALSAPDAIRLLEQEKFDAIISDYQMPGMDGIQFLVEVRTRLGPIPFILFTGKGREEVVIQAINSGADFYLQKGGEPKAQFAELVHKIKQAALRNKAENSLRRSEEKYRHLIEHSNEAIVVAQDGMLKLVNHKTIEFTGYSEQELFSMQFSAFIHADDRAMVVERYQKRMKGEEGSSSRYAFRLSSKDGIIKWVELSVVMIDWDGRPATLNFLTDITERKRADDSLREEQQFSKLMLDSLPGIFYLYTYPENRMVRWNKQHETLLGYTAEEIKGKLGTDLHLPEYKDAVLKAIDEVMEKGQNSVESTLMAKDGHQIPFFFTGVRFETPDQLYFMGIGIDITERKVAEAALLKKTEELNTSYEEIAATGEELRQNLDELTRQEEALRESKRELSDIIEFLPDATFVIDRQAIVIAWNRAMEDLTGIRAEDMLGKGNYEYAIPFYGERRPILIDLVMIQDQDVLDKYSSVQKEGDSLTAETGMAHLGGKNLFLWGKAILIKNSHGEVVGAIESIRDITAWKHAEKKLVSTQEHLKEAHRIAGIGTWDWVIETDTVTWSEELFNIAGRDPSQPAPTYAEFPRIYTPASWERLSAAVTNALNTGEPYNLELELIRTDGTIRWINAFGGVKRDNNGKIIGLHGTLQDINERKRAENTLRKSEEKYRQLIELAQEGIWTIDGDGNTTYVNQQMAKILGYTAEEMLGVHLFSFMDDAGKIIAAGNIERRRQGITEDHEFEFITKRGNRIYAHLSTSPIIDDKGVYLGSLAVVSDITGRKTAEEALKNEKQRLANIIEGTRAGTWEWNVQTGETIFNEQWAEIIGYTLSEISPVSIKTWMNYAHPDDLQKSGELLERHFLQKSEWYECESRMKHKNGDWVWVLDRGKVASWTKDGKPLWMYGTHQDITERKRAESAITESFAIFKTVMDSLDALVYVSDMKTHEVLFINQYGKEIFGDITGKICWKSIQVDQNGPCPFCTNEKIIDLDGNPAGIIVWEFKNTINRHWYECHDSAIRWTDGRIVRIEIASDITERKRVQEALAESESFNRNLVENLPDYIAVYGMDGNLLYVNPASARTLGYDAEVLIGTHVLSYIAEEYHETVIAKLTARKEGVETSPYEIEMVTRNGSLRSVIVKATPIQYQNNPAILLLLIDITKRKLAEEELINFSTSLAAANKKLNLLSGITRHDINNQLTVLMGYLAIMEKKQIEPTQTEYFRKVSTAAKRIAAMVQFTKEYENIGVNAPTWLDCRTLVDTASKQAPLGKVTVKNDLPANAEVFADPLIVKVCYNLMDNAARYGSKITTIRFSATEVGDDQVIVCEDDGDGVVAEEKEKIFERGFGKNTGLGLALAREILDITGITIKETGEPGKGARFEMTVPKRMWRMNPGSY